MEMKSILAVPFNTNNYNNFVLEFFNEIDRVSYKEIKPNATFANAIEYYSVHGTYKDPEGNDIIVLSVKVKNNSNARQAQRNFVSYLLTNDFNQYSAAMVAYYDDVRTNWKLSFVTVEMELGDNGIELKFKPAKRFSFLVGENEPTRTYTQQLGPVYTSRENPTLERITDAFSVNKLSKDFYEDYKKKFFELVDYLEKDTVFENEAHRLGYDDSKKFAVTFAKKTLGQMVFLHFIQKKGWLGVRDKWGDGSQTYLIDSTKGYGDKNYFNEFLEPLFYCALNKKRNNDMYLNSKIPFLNGGLFNPIEHYDWKNTDFNIPNDYWFNDDESGLLNVLSQYNFTVDESDPTEQEVAVDPEMLGKIFESLLDVKDRSSLGAFYTPREIVHYMCENVLATKIANELELDYDSVLNYVRYGDALKETDFIKEFASDIDEIVSNFTIVDPAVGSGAFLVGMLNQITKLRCSLCEYTNKSVDIYQMKLQIIENSLFGVDIEYDAVEIAKLRLWLSLIVDQTAYENAPRPLPNLNFHLRVGNSLVDVFEGITLWNPRWRSTKFKERKYLQVDIFNTDAIDMILHRLKEAKRQYFLTSDEKEKQRLNDIIEREQIELIRSELVARGKYSVYDDLEEMLKKKTKPFFIWELEFSDVFDRNNGFDIVIGNPPYIKEMGNSDVFDPVNKSTIGQKYHQGKMDFWYYFVHLACQLINDKGVISFITSRYWLNNAGASKLRERIKDELVMTNVLDIGSLKLFDNVVGYHMIHEYEKKNCNKTKLLYKKVENTLDDIYSNINTDNIKITKMNFESIFKGKKNEISFEGCDIAVDTIELGELCDVSQGVVEASDSISSRMYQRNPLEGYSVGQGIFVLTNEEKEQLCLNTFEQSLMKPYLKGENIKRYHIEPNLYELIYSDKDSKILIEQNCNYTHLKNHLDKFQMYITSSNGPYGLHRARKKEFFDTKKIIMPNMFSANDFAIDYDNHYYVGMGCQVIKSKNDNTFPLEYILAIINSKYAMNWFDKNCKHRGAGVDVGVDKIRSFPIAKVDYQIVEEVVLMVKQMENSDDIDFVKSVDKKLDELIDEIYKSH